MNDYDVIIVGGGIAGLTAAAYASKANLRVCLIEKHTSFGGNISSFSYHGHQFDGGIRSIESSGVLKPMIADLDLDITLIKSPVTLGIKHDVITLSDRNDMDAYEALLIKHFPKEAGAIKAIVKKMKNILNHMDVLYGIDNPIIVDIKKRPRYALSLIPWLFKFIPTILTINRLTMPVNNYLRKYTNNQALIDIITQHFFKSTPTFFALGYFNIYFDYYYPLGGTGQLIKALEDSLSTTNATLLKSKKITSIDAYNHEVTDHQGTVYRYKKLVWAADLNALYNQLTPLNTFNPRTQSRINAKKELLINKRGAESVLTVYLQTDLPLDYFSAIASGHFFYTASTLGIHANTYDYSKDQSTLFDTLKSLYDLETYEISIPALRDSSLSPKNETGLIVAILFSYDLIKHIEDCGFYDDFKAMTQTHFIKHLSQSIYPNLENHIIRSFCSTPLTVKNNTSSTDGAIIGWAYDSNPIPVHHKMSKITQSVNTPIPDIYQAGQWSFSPAGVPISIITGKLAADKTIKALKPIKY